jgi:hypothetical protein
MKHEHKNYNHDVLFSNRSVASIATCIWMALSVVSTLQAQTPTPTPAPTATPLSSPGGPPATTDQEGLAQVRDEIIITRDEIITFRRLVIIMAGIGLGWQTCLLLFKHH